MKSCLIIAKASDIVNLVIIQSYFGINKSITQCFKGYRGGCRKGYILVSIGLCFKNGIFLVFSVVLAKFESIPYCHSVLAFIGYPIVVKALGKWERVCSLWLRTMEMMSKRTSSSMLCCCT